MSGSPSMCQLTLEWRKRNSNTIFVYFPPPRFIHWSSPRVLTFVHSISDQMLGQFLSRFFTLPGFASSLTLYPSVFGFSLEKLVLHFDRRHSEERNISPTAAATSGRLL